MKFDTLQKLRKLFAILVATVAAGVLIVMLLVAHVLHRSEQRYYANAEETSKNLAISLENFLHSYYQEVDLALRRSGEEYSQAHVEHRFNDAAFSTYLRSLKERIPQARAIRGSDAAGRVIYGDDIDLVHPHDLTIREFFQRAKAEREMIFGLPVQSRISGEWAWPLVYALTLPDGSFGGISYANLSNTRILELFSSLKIGPQGSIVLLDDKKRILHRYPANELQLGVPVPVSQATEAALNSKSSRVSYRSISVRDGKERVISLEKIGKYPVYVVVALASEDFLAPWHREIRNSIIGLSIFVLLAIALLAGVRYALHRQYQSLVLLVETDNALQGSLAALTESESRWRSLTEGLPQMVWTATSAFHIDFMSHHWGTFSDVPAEQLLRTADWSGVIHDDDRPLLAAEWRRALAAGDQFRCDVRLRRRDGEWRMFDNHALPQRSSSGAIVSWVGSSTDITEARAAHDLLLKTKEEAVQAGRAKSEFVANMSHEIRSPMNAVLGMLQLLQQTQMNERQQDYAAKAHSAASALLGLLNDILDFSKVEAGKLTLDPHPFRLDKLWRDLAVILSANVGGKDVEVLFRIDPSLPQLVVGDALRLQQILLNLAGNAIKFTAQGEVVLSAQLLVQTESTLSVAFAIRDTGIGISDEQCRRIFDGFSQAEASTARRYGGTGLGLAISQRLVRMMGGTLRVTSELGQGSVFDFVIEFRRASRQQSLALAAADVGADSSAASASSANALLRGLRCLVVDDNQVARMVLSEMAVSFGWVVDAVEGGKEALAAVAANAPEQPYDVVFIDWRMPGLDGWDTSCQIRALTPSGKMPLIVMVTAHDRELLAQRHVELAPVLDGFVVKPVTASMLFDAVADARLGRRMVLSGIAAPSMQRLAGLRLLLVDDNPANQQVASELLGNDGAQITVANSGAAAIEAISGGGPLPDLILMDIQMPEMDGYEATGAIIELLGARTPPVIAMTANAMESDRQAALDAGMVDHVGKPFDLVQLINVILYHTGKAGGSADAVATPAAYARADDAAVAQTESGALSIAEPGLNSAAALKRMGGLHSVYLMALRSFVVEAGKLEVELKTAVAARDHGLVPRALHTLKGLAGTVGADRLAGLSGQVEQAFKNDAASDSAWQQLDLVLEACPLTVADVEQLVRQLDPPSPIMVAAS